VNLAYADIIVSGGKGLKNADNFKLVWDLARVLGAEVGRHAPGHAGRLGGGRAPGRPDRQDRAAQALHRRRHLGAIQHRVGMEAPT
jgi:electron transfer flavoprotein alpha subunit